MKFIDLFAGLGGFHLALSRLGHECVFACEKEEHLRVLYEKNFGMLPAADIRNIDVRTIPGHDILCAGFPCQPFSKAGEQQGFDCPKNGDLFDYVVAIVKHHQPKFLVLENVPNLRNHNGGGTWEDLVKTLKRAKYDVRAERFSPHDFGIPQRRERIFIVASLLPLDTFAWPKKKPVQDLSIETVLDEHPADAKPLSERKIHCLEVWQDFLRRMPKNVELPHGPLWSMEFGATYPFEETTPHATNAAELRRYRGSFGLHLRGDSHAELVAQLPSHARTRQSQFPTWKQRFIRANREFYIHNRSWIDPWISSIQDFPSSLQKLEWNCRGGKRNIWQYMIQFRASGVRVKHPKTAPSLVAMTSTQVPVVGWERRFMTAREGARLQSMNGLRHLPDSHEAAFAALGNAVNVEVVRRVADALFGRGLTAKPSTQQGDHRRVASRRASAR